MNRRKKETRRREGKGEKQRYKKTKLVERRRTRRAKTNKYTKKREKGSRII